VLHLKNQEYEPPLWVGCLWVLTIVVFISPWVVPMLTVVLELPPVVINLKPYNFFVGGLLAVLTIAVTYWDKYVEKIELF